MGGGGTERGRGASRQGPPGLKAYKEGPGKGGLGRLGSGCGDWAGAEETFRPATSVLVKTQTPFVHRCSMLHPVLDQGR